MSKTISESFKAHLAGELTTVAMCWKITRTDGEEFFFTDHDVNLLIDDDLYEAASGALGTTLSQKLDLSVDNMEISGFLQSEKIKEADIVAGLFDYADVDIFLVNWTDFQATQVT